MSAPRYWFRKRRWGLGYSPCSPEGWIATLIAVSAIVGGVNYLAPREAVAHPWLPLLWTLGWGAAIVAVAYFTHDPSS
ncbi:MAG: hypothetical protein ACYDA1_03360 [Vulcanimicrobiaceae bacterium]